MTYEQVLKNILRERFVMHAITEKDSSLSNESELMVIAGNINISATYYKDLGETIEDGYFSILCKMVGILNNQLVNLNKETN